MITLLLILTGTAYAIFILRCWQGWKKTKPLEQTDNTFKTHVSIIIPARNEEDNLLNCLDSIAKQSYPKNLLEVIICDDNSDDQTAAIAKKWIVSHELNAKIISSGTWSGKKHALNEGIKNATGE